MAPLNPVWRALTALMSAAGKLASSSWKGTEYPAVASRDMWDCWFDGATSLTLAWLPLLTVRRDPSLLKYFSAVSASCSSDISSLRSIRPLRTSRGISLRKCVFLMSSSVTPSVSSTMEAARSFGRRLFRRTPSMAV